MEDHESLEGKAQHQREHAVGSGMCRGLLVLGHGLHGAPEEDGRHDCCQGEGREDAQRRHFRPPEG